jgi:hypothetical protein
VRSNVAILNTTALLLLLLPVLLLLLLPVLLLLLLPHCSAYGDKTCLSPQLLARIKSEAGRHSSALSKHVATLAGSKDTCAAAAAAALQCIW